MARLRISLNDLEDPDALLDAGLQVRRRPTRLRCRKRRFKDDMQATSALQRILFVTGGETGPVRTYECFRCRGWHLTSMKYNGQDAPVIPLPVILTDDDEGDDDDDDPDDDGGGGGVSGRPAPVGQIMDISQVLDTKAA